MDQDDQVVLRPPEIFPVIVAKIAGLEAMLISGYHPCWVWSQPSSSTDEAFVLASFVASAFSNGSVVHVSHVAAYQELDSCSLRCKDEDWE